MTTIETIRHLDAQGVSGRQIATQLGLSRDTVSKYPNTTDFSPAPPAAQRQPGARALTGYTTIIETWLADDVRRPRKQRHTASRVYHRLVNEHDYDGSYSPIQRFIKKYHERHRSRSNGYLELVWAPGLAQVDFGQAQALIAGIMHTLHMLVVTFPFSNARYVQVFRAETSECICQGLRTIFEHASTVPTQLILDNATSAGRRCGTIITESKLFAAFKAHYRTSARYCNPHSGNEKGNVENAVGYIRRNLFVPEPSALTLTTLNADLLDDCDRLGNDKHWKKDTLITDLFTQDRAAGHALPGIGFDAVRYESRKADKTGTLTIADHTYLAGPSYANRALTVAIRHDTISILDEYSHPVVEFERVYGQSTTTAFHPETLLPALVTKPGAWSNSPVRALVPDPVRDWVDAADHPDRSRLFHHLDDTAQATTFVTATDAATRLITGGDDPTGPGLPMLARRLDQGSEPPATNADLSIYDQFTRVKETA